MTLIPHHCWNTARNTPKPTIFNSLGSRRSLNRTRATSSVLIVAGDFVRSCLGVSVSTQAGQDLPGPVTLAVLHQPPRAFGDEKHQQKERRGRNRFAPNIHRQPTVPFQDSRINSAEAPSGTSRAISKLVICAAENADDDGQLVDGDKPAPHLRRRDLGDIHGREVRRQTDPQAAEKTGQR